MSLSRPSPSGSTSTHPPCGTTLFRPDSFTPVDLPDRESVYSLRQRDAEFSYHRITDGAEVRRITDGKTAKFYSPWVSDTSYVVFVKARGRGSITIVASDSVGADGKCTVRVFDLPANPDFLAGAGDNAPVDNVLEAWCVFEIFGQFIDAQWVCTPGFESSESAWRPLPSGSDESQAQALMLLTPESIVACRWPDGTNLQGPPFWIEYVEGAEGGYFVSNTSSRGVFAVGKSEGTSIELWRAFPLVKRMGLSASFDDRIEVAAFLPDDSLIVVLLSGRVLRCSPDLKETSEIGVLPGLNDFQIFDSNVFFLTKTYQERLSGDPEILLVQTPAFEFTEAAN